MAIDNNKKKTRKYRLALTDAVSHERLRSVTFSQSAFLIAVVSSVILLLLVFYLLVAMRIDSLETQILQWELYTENLKKVVAGEQPLLLDSLILRQQASRKEGDAAYLAKRDSLLRARIAEAEQFDVSGVRRNLPIEALSFYTPVKGVISQGFDRALHPYVDITAPAGTAVMSVLDGTVVFSGWDEAEGYTLAIQHKGDLISIYGHNEKLLKKSGDAVKAGTPVALTGRSASLTKGDHLRFELWYEGEAVDPAKYISF